MEGCGVLGTVRCKTYADILYYTHFLPRVEAVLLTPHTWPVIRYYAMVDPCTLSIINR